MSGILDSDLYVEEDLSGALMLEWFIVVFLDGNVRPSLDGTPVSEWTSTMSGISIVTCAWKRIDQTPWRSNGSMLSSLERIGSSSGSS